LGKKSSFFAIFGGEKATFVCEKTILMLSFFSQRLRKSVDSPSRGVVDSPTHEQSSDGGHSYVASLKVFFGMVRGALSKGRNIQEFSVGDTSVGDELTLHPSKPLRTL
jgi:hypothetical protein